MPGSYTGYRPDLQGIRALAVGLVLASHLGFSPLEGGFLGVDVFFVLSGFLITGLLVKEWDHTGRLDLRRFYARRVKRLFPAMSVMIVTVFVFAVVWLPGSGLKRGLAAAPYALTWTSNFFLDFRQLGYFESLEGTDFFLHTWSLAVEEQFYLIWPLLLLALFGWLGARRLPGSRFGASAGMAWVAVIGFAFCYILAYTTIDSAFYQMPARIWEFAVGAWCALVLRKGMTKRTVEKPRIWRVAYRAAPALGVAMIVGSGFLMGEKIQHPGLVTLLPVVGTALVILGSGNGLAARNLSSKPLVWLGDRSYSIYLWHWPALLVCQFFIVGEETRAALPAMLLTLLLSMLTYRLVEYPFWKGRYSSASGALVLSSALCTLIPAIGLTGLVVGALNDQDDDSSDALLAVRFDVPSVYAHGCDDWYNSADVVPCVFGSEGGEKHLVYIGDSIGLQWFSAVSEAFIDDGWSVTVFTKSACPMVDRSIYYERLNRVYEVCSQWRARVLERLPALGPDLVIVGSSSSYDYSKTQWVEGSRAVFFSLQAAADKVLVLAGTPGLPFHGPACVERELAKWGELPAGNCSSSKGISEARHVESYLRQAAASFQAVSVVGFVDLVCPAGLCRAMDEEEQAVFRDKQHLADSFVSKISPEFDQRLKEGLATIKQDVE